MGTTADKLNKLEETKAAIKTAITNKGVEVSDSDTFASYADKINSIPTGGGGDLDFSQLGYSYTPEYIQKGYEAGKKYYETFNSRTDFTSYNSVAFEAGIDVTELRYFPKINVTEDYTYLYNNFINNSFYNLEIIPDFPFGEDTVSTRLQGMSLLRSVHLGGKLILQTTNYFNEDINLEEVSGTIDISYPNALDYLFDDCNKLRDISKLNLVGTPSGTATDTFYKCGSSDGSNKQAMMLDTIPQLDLSYITKLQDYVSFAGIKVIPYINTKNATTVDLGSVYGYKVEGLDLDNNTYNYPFSGDLYYIKFYNLGKAEGWKKAIISSLNNWGKEDSNIPESQGSLQAAKDSLITHSFDRATAGYSTFTINLASNIKNNLSEEEIAQITAKGFTIA